MAKILLCVTGSIAAYKIIELTHSLKKAGHQVKIILSREACRFVTPLSFSAFAADVYTDEINPYAAGEVMQHINLARWPDLIIVAPLSANSLSKIAAGFADNLLTSTILATSRPVYLVPAMNMFMWQNKIIQDNIVKLKSVGFSLWGPASGLQACGDDGDGRMLEAGEILANITHTLLSPDRIFAGKKVVITAGATIEEIDPVRYISNYSSGKMGYALARAFAAAGAQVALISGNSNLDTPNNISKLLKTGSADKMLEACLTESASADIFIGCAAVSDYTALKRSSHKIKKLHNTGLTLELTRNPDIIALVKQRYPNLFVLGFAAETENLPEYAKIKIRDKNLDAIVANDVSNGAVFGDDQNKITLIDKSLTLIKEVQGSKDTLAHEILRFIFDKNMLR